MLACPKHIGHRTLTIESGILLFAVANFADDCLVRQVDPHQLVLHNPQPLVYIGVNKFKQIRSCVKVEVDVLGPRP